MIGHEALPPRFWAKVEEDDRGCWVWQAAVKGHGYGSFHLNGALRSAHRLVWENLVGPIPDGLTIDHLCRNKLCVNPAHLEPVTAAENLRRRYREQTHCLRGHLLAGANLSIKTNGTRRCKACHNARNRARRLAERAA